jgi:Rad3-related DNA helicase
MVQYKKEDIVEAIQKCLKVSKFINPSKELVSIVYNILIQFFVENKKYVILEAPTGSGKTIIGFIVFFCTQYLEAKNAGENVKEFDNGRIDYLSDIAYYLTSAKVLQEQIESDLDKFDFHKYINILKGQSNYNCLLAIKNNEEKISYSDRPCIGSTFEERSFPENDNFCEFNDVCPYFVARNIASDSPCAVMNYAYFLNFFRMETPFYFMPRKLTICDEAHLIPDIVCNIFNYELTPHFAQKVTKLVYNIETTFGQDRVGSLKVAVSKLFYLFKFPLSKINHENVLNYIDNYELVYKQLKGLQNDSMLNSIFKLEIKRLVEQSERFLETTTDLYKLLDERFSDVYFESEKIIDNRSIDVEMYKHTIKDLSEADLVQKKFIKNVEKCLFMSATIGNTKEFATLMGFDEIDYIGMRMPSTFDFSNSPIYLCNSAYLNYKNFSNNIDKVLMDTIKIVDEYHPKEKGIIHTSTFNICNLLKQKIRLLSSNYDRFLFYQTAEEKEKQVEILKNSTQPFVLVGPSLYEGIDLKDEQGRFNILIKVPYSSLTGYTKEKSERFPFWYNRQTLEKIVQAIGRTNRHKHDYSKIYLLDSLFGKIIFDCNDIITGRLETRKIY